MRELKFRTWFFDNGEMTKPWSIYDVSKKIDPNFDFTIKEPYMAGTGGMAIGGVYLFSERPHRIMQYMGVDKNSKDIYEGDIVKAYIPSFSKDESKNGRTSVIVWDKFSCRFMFEFYRTIGGGKIKYLVGVNKAEWIEVIGNIYENAELLEKEE